MHACYVVSTAAALSAASKHEVEFWYTCPYARPMISFGRLRIRPGDGGTRQMLDSGYKSIRAAQVLPAMMDLLTAL